MAFSVAQKVRVADQSSDYHGQVGVVIAVSGDDHDVRLDGHGCGQTVPLLTVQLKADTTTHPTDYTNC